MIWARVAAPGGAALAVASVHLTVGAPVAAAHEAALAAEHAVRWAGADPLVFGGDFNLSPGRSPTLFAELEERFGLAPATAPDAIDHLLARGLRPLEPPRRLDPRARELPAAGARALRLSDHAPVLARYERVPA